MPLAVVLSTLEVAFWSVTPDPSYSAAYAGNTARSLLLFMLGITIFYTGEAMHRDRDLRIEPLLWSQPVPNYVLLLSKFLATLLLTLALILVVALITIALQSAKHNGPIELSAYLRIYCIILIPNAIFLAAAALALNVLLRDRYLTYAAAIGTCAGLFLLVLAGTQRLVLQSPAFSALAECGSDRRREPDLSNPGAESFLDGDRLHWSIAGPPVLPPPLKPKVTGSRPAHQFGMVYLGTARLHHRSGRRRPARGRPVNASPLIIEHSQGLNHTCAETAAQPQSCRYVLP